MKPIGWIFASFVVWQGDLRSEYELLNKRHHQLDESDSNIQTQIDTCKHLLCRVTECQNDISQHDTNSLSRLCSVLSNSDSDMLKNRNK